MQAIIEFFTSISDGVIWLFDFVIGFVEDMIDLVKMLGMAVTALPAVFTLMPRPAIMIATSVLAVAVAYKIVGREG